MIKRKKFGQNFLKSDHIAKFIVSSLNPTRDDIVYEIGTGRGILLPYLCKKSKHVITVEKDKSLYEEAIKKFSNIENLTIIQGDGFKQNKKFDIFVSNLPYSESKTAIQWMLMQKFTAGIIMIQYDFAEKLFATKQNRKAISVLAQSGFNMEILRYVSKEDFSPQPKIKSTIVSFRRRTSFSKELIHTVNLIFSFRRKKIQNIGKQLGITIKSDLRLEEMSNYEIIKFAKTIRKF